MLVITATEAVDATPATNVDKAKIHINNITGTNVVTLGAGDTVTAADGTTVTITLSEANRLAAQAISGAAALIGDGVAVVLDLEAGAVMDLAGNANVADLDNTVFETADAVAPAFSATSPAAAAHVRAGFTVEYTLSENVDSGTIGFTSGATQTYTLTAGDRTKGAHAVSEASLTGVALVDGTTYSIAFDATDIVGNHAAAVTNAGVVYDTTAPAAPSTPDLDATDDSGSSSTDNVTDAITALTLGGTAEAGSTVEVFDGATSQGTAAADAVSGVWSRDINLAEGSHSITARATDAAGNESAASSALTANVDTTDPTTPTVQAPGYGVSVADSTPVLDWSDSSDASAVAYNLEVNDSAGNTVLAVMDLPTSTYTITTALTNGTYRYQVRATDAAGNSGSWTDWSLFTVSVDMAAPTVTVNTPNGGEHVAAGNTLVIHGPPTTT